MYGTPRWLLLDSNISNANPNKKKMKLFLYFNNSHANQTDIPKIYDFFIHVNINENLKNIDAKKFCFNRV